MFELEPISREAAEAILGNALNVAAIQTLSNAEAPGAMIMIMERNPDTRCRHGWR